MRTRLSPDLNAWVDCWVFISNLLLTNFLLKCYFMVIFVYSVSIFNFNHLYGRNSYIFYPHKQTPNSIYLGILIQAGMTDSLPDPLILLNCWMIHQFGSRCSDFPSPVATSLKLCFCVRNDSRFSWVQLQHILAHLSACHFLFIRGS